jgi:hypothetical protein
MQTLKMINTKLHKKTLRKKWEHCDAVATTQTATGRHGVMHIWEDSVTDVSSGQALGTTVGSKNEGAETDCSYSNGLLCIEIDPTTWIERLQSLPVPTATLY